MNIHINPVLVSKAFFDELPEVAPVPIKIGRKWKQPMSYKRPPKYWVLYEYVPSGLSGKIGYKRCVIEVCPQRIKI
jgi:hypothetical protein